MDMQVKVSLKHLLDSDPGDRLNVYKMVSRTDE